MPRKASGETKTYTVNRKRKNGDIYVFECKSKYNPEKRFNEVLGSKLVGKIPAGGTEVVPTRPKRGTAMGKAGTGGGPVAEAGRMRTGMMDIIDHIGRASGIDGAVYTSTDEGTAQKALSLARYLLGTDGCPFPGIVTWQVSHPLPYEHWISEDQYHELFERVGRDESFQQGFFRIRCEGLGERPVLAYDSTTVSTYSRRLPEARPGFNKAHDGLDTVKLLTLYSIETRQPVAFAKQPGNLPDVTGVGNALRQMRALGVDKAVLVTDNGYYSEDNLSEMLQARYDFITLVKTGLAWVRPVLEEKKGQLSLQSTICPFDVSVHGVTVALRRTFKRRRKYANHRTGAGKGEEEAFERTVHLHLYYNKAKAVSEEQAFDADLAQIKGLLEAGTALEDLPEQARRKAGEFLLVRERQGRLEAGYNDTAIAEHKKLFGCFALVSNWDRDTFSCLRYYRRRETVEAFFEAGKQHADGRRTRVWSSDVLQGRLFVQFLALCYHEYLSEQLRQLRSTLGRENGDAEHDKKANLDLENKLRTWLENNSLHTVLTWFDTVETVNVHTDVAKVRWSTETTKRDRMFLEKLGMESS